MRRAFVTSEKPKNADYAQLELSHLQFAQAVAQRVKINVSWQTLPSLTGGATSTFDEAQDALSYAKKDWKRIIIVTDMFHTRRASFAFDKIFKGSGIKVQVAGAPNEVFSLENWWKSDKELWLTSEKRLNFPFIYFGIQSPN